MKGDKKSWRAFWGLQQNWTRNTEDFPDSYIHDQQLGQSDPCVTADEHHHTFDIRARSLR